MNQMHKIPAQTNIFELVEKRSRFITYCQQVNSQVEFKHFLNELKQQYPDARHFCYGFRIGPISSAQRGFSDDGEPSGTAGMPIVNVIDHSEFSDIAIIIVRYFGGTKLGTGGLARAYSQAAKQVLEGLEWEVYEAKQEIELQCEFQQEHQLRYLITRLAGEISSVDYQQTVKMVVNVAANTDLSTLNLYLLDRGDH